MYGIIILPPVYMVLKLVPHTEGITEAEDVREYGAEEDILA
jgi:hypothetical protein